VCTLCGGLATDHGAGLFSSLTHLLFCRNLSLPQSSSTSLNSHSPTPSPRHRPPLPHHYTIATLPEVPSPISPSRLSTTKSKGSSKIHALATKAVSFNIDPRRDEDSETDYSDLEDSGEECSSSAKNSGKMSSSGSEERENKKAAVMDSSSRSMPAILLGYNKKSGETTNGGERLPPQTPPIPIGSRLHSQDSTSSSGSDGREGSFTVNKVTGDIAASPSQKRSSPAQQWSSKVTSGKFGSSDGVASAIQQILRKRSSSHELKEPASSNDTLSPNLEMGNGSSREDGGKNSKMDWNVLPRAGSVSSTTEVKKTQLDSEPGNILSNSEVGEDSSSLASTDLPTAKKEKGGVAKTRAMFERIGSAPAVFPPVEV